MAALPSTRRSADERREEIVTIALRHFAEGGYHGTSTDAIAKETGLSQPYLFRLFGTKRGLFLACCAESKGRIRETFETAARDVPRDERLGTMAEAYIDLLADEHQLRFQLQMYAACSDPEIREAVRSGYRELVETVRDLTGAPEADIFAFFSHGMLLNVIASLDLHAIAGDDEWAAAWTDPKPMLHPEA